MIVHETMWQKNIPFLVIFSIWASVSGEGDNAIGDKLDVFDPASRNIHKIFGQWGGNIEKCWSGGDDKLKPTYFLGNLYTGDISYDTLDEDTIIKAGGDIELYTKSVGAIIYKSLLLDHYIQEADSKVYFGELHLEGHSGWATQVSHVKLTLTVQQSGDLYLQTYVYAGSWGALSCAHTNCAISSLIIST